MSWGFQPTKAYLASFDHALSVEFLNTKGVTPKTEGSLPAASALTKAPDLRKVLYQNLWEGISLTYESTQSGITENTYQIAPSRMSRRSDSATMFPYHLRRMVP